MTALMVKSTRVKFLTLGRIGQFKFHNRSISGAGGLGDSERALTDSREERPVNDDWPIQGVDASPGV